MMFSFFMGVFPVETLEISVEVLQALSKIVPILSLLPVALVQSIVGYTGGSTER